MKGLVVLCLSSVVAACSFAPTPPPAPPRTTKLGLELQQFELANGLRVVLVHDAKARELGVTMRYRVGQVDEPAGQGGIAHLVEHLMFQQVLGSQPLWAHLEAGATSFNGFTTPDATTYVAHATPDRLDELLSIEAVRAGLRCTSITDTVFEREREVVLNELREHADSTEIFGALHRAAYPEGHPYRTEHRDEESVAALTRAQACAFADAHYAPSNAVLVVSGDITALQVQTSLKKFMTHLPRREITAPVDVPAIKDQTGTARASVDVPIDDDAILVAWALPTDPLVQIRVRALATTVERLVDAKIKGKVQLVLLGDARAPMLGLVAMPGEGEGERELLRAVEMAANSVGSEFEGGGLIPFGTLAFERVQQQAIYELFASLDDTQGRDMLLASEVLAGHDPSAALAAEFRGLRELTTGEATVLASEYLGLRHARVATLHASGKKRGHSVVLAAAIHDLGQRRDPPDPGLAAAPLVETAPPPETTGMRTRTLPNGLHVVLLPLTAVPTVDARLVFTAGTGDDPADRRGVALLAAGTLTWDFRYLNDLLSFASAGGRVDAEVSLDHTAFIVHGLDMHLDFLLAGLRRIVRDGRYETTHVAAVLHRETKSDDDAGAFSDAWRAALFGASHPYVVAGVVRHVDPRIARLDLERFRTIHFVPNNATLVISGHFDPALADRWIDFMFADWASGSPGPRLATLAAPAPASIARYADTSQVSLQLAIPLAPSPDLAIQAQRLVVAEMLDALAEDVRHQLGASYGLDAQLMTERLAADYLLAGSIEAPRAADAVKLLADRIAALRDDADVAARAFVAARARVVTRLRSLTGGAGALSNRIETDTALGRPPFSDLELARRVAGLTVEQLSPALADLEPKRAVIAMRGPEAAVTAAFAVLGRAATVVPPVPPGASEDPPSPPAAPHTEETSQHLTAADLEDAITGEPPISHLATSFAVGYTAGSVSEVDVSGFTVVGDVGYRFDAITSLGLHLELGDVTGSYTTGATMPVDHAVSVQPIDLGWFARAEAYDRFWGSVFMSFHFQRIDDGGTAFWSNGITAGLEAGLDVYKLGSQRLALYGRLQSVLLADAGFDVFTLGVAVRR